MALSTSDIPTLIAMQKAVEDEQAIWGYCADSAEDWTQRNLSWTYVLEEDAKPVGFIYCAPNEYSGECVFDPDSRILEIVDLVVLEECRSKGIGHKLMAAVQKQAIQDGFSHLRVYSASKRFDEILAFYRSCGFEPWYLEMTKILTGEK